jgi:hypothetical protein
VRLLLAGPVEGYLKAFYERISDMEPHWVIQAGDFGAWVDAARMDKASRKHAGKEFALAYVGALILPQIPTVFVAGVHDDNRFLQGRIAMNNTEVLSNVHWLAQGYRTTIGWDVPIRVTGLGRAYSEATYNEQYSKRSYRHYTRHDIERACSSGPTDLLVLYEHLDSPGLRNVIFATRPKLILTVEHPNRKVYEEVQGTPVISLGRQCVTLLEYKDGEFIV